MGYSNIIDSLTSKRVDEGLLSSIEKNTNNLAMKSLIDALSSGDINKLDKKSIEIDKYTLYNKSPLYIGDSKNIIFSHNMEVGLDNTKNVVVYNKGNDFYIAEILKNHGVYDNENWLYPTVIYTATEDVVKGYIDDANNKNYPTTSYMTECGVVLYDEASNAFLSDKKEVTKRVFKKCSEVLKDSLPNFIKVFSKESLPLDGYQVLFFTYDNGITDVVIKMYSNNRDILVNFSDSVLFPMKKGNVKTTSRGCDDFVTFNFTF